MKVSAALPAGVSALFFEAAQNRRRLEARLASGLEEAGFSEVLLPILDYLDPYEPLLTSAGRAELYRFIDRDGEQLALRADFTTMLARLLAPRLPALELPLRFFYRGDVVRYQETRPGLQRESYQMGAELLGVPGAQAEREMLELCLELLQDLGLSDLRVVLGFAGALDELLLAGQEQGLSARQLAAAVERRERQPVRAAHPALLQVVENGVPADPGDLGAPGAGALETLGRLRRDLAERFPETELILDLAEFAGTTRDPQLAEARGRRSYYDGSLFRVYGGAGSEALAGGGRYDQLFGTLGAGVPAVGFFLAVDRLLRANGGEP